MAQLDYLYSGGYVSTDYLPGLYFPFVTSGTTLSLPDLENLRYKQAHSDIYLSVLQPTTLLTALVNNVAITRGARTIAYDNGSGSGFATIEAGQTLEVDTADGTKKVRVKTIAGAQAAGTITIDENAIDWADNQVLRIKWNYEIWPVPPRISGGIFYKFYDTVFPGFPDAAPPVAIAGPHRADFLSAGTAVFSIDASDSYAIASGATISTYLWQCASGVIAAPAAAATTITFNAAGQYWLKLTVTDSNGLTQSTYRAIFVYSTSTLPYRDFTVQSLEGNWQSGGYRFTVEATGDVTKTDFPDGSLALLWYENYYDGVEGYVNLWNTSDNIICAGYIRSDNDLDDYTTGAGRVEFDVVTPEALLDEMTDFGSVTIESVAAPTTWYQYATWLTVGRGIHHQLRWHSTTFTCVDVYGLTTNTLGVQQCDFTEPSLLQRVNGLGYQRGILSKMVSDRMGRLHFVADSQLLNDAGRAALSTVFAINNEDVSGDVNLTREHNERIAVADLDGFSWDGATATPFIALVPGYSGVSFAEFRGTGSLPTRNQVLDDQTDANEKVGRVLAAANNPYKEFRITCPSGYVGALEIVPSVGWYEIDIANSDLVRALSLNGLKMLCRQISHRIDIQAGFVQTSAIFEIEAQGPDGIDISGAPSSYPKSYPATPAPPAPSWAQPATNITAGATTVLATSDGWRFVAMSKPYSSTETLILAEIGTGVLDPPTAASILTITGTTPGLSATGNPYGTTKVEGNMVSLDLIPTTQKGISVFTTGAGNVALAQVIYDNAGTMDGGAGDFYSHSATPYNVDVVALNSQNAIAFVRDDNVGVIDGKAVYLGLTPATNTVSVGSDISLHGSTRDCEAMSGCRLDDDHAAVIYADNDNSGYPTANIINENAGTLTAGSPAVLDTSEAMLTSVGALDIPRRRITLLDSNTFVTAYGRNTTGDSRLVACNWTGTTIGGVGTPVTVEANYNLICLDRVSDTKVLVVYAKINSIKAQTFNISGTVITAAGDEVEITVALLPNYMDVKVFSTTTAVVVWTSSTGNGDLYGAVLTLP